VVVAYEQKVVDLHSYVWVRFQGLMESEEPEGEPLKMERSPGGIVTKEYKFRRVREDEQGNVINQYIRTTPGRVIYHQTILSVINN
jgi:DNA-directed RNA polymerase subunit beta'